METPVTIMGVLEGVALGSECKGCDGLIERTCPAARLVLKVEEIVRFEQTSGSSTRNLGHPSSDYFTSKFETFRQAIACCPGYANVNYFVAQSLPRGNMGLTFNMLDLQTKGMAEEAGIDPPLVYLDLPKNCGYEPPEPSEPLRVAR